MSITLPQSRTEAMIKRYKLMADEDMVAWGDESDDGDWVKFEDVAKLIREKNLQSEELKLHKEEMALAIAECESLKDKVIMENKLTKGQIARILIALGQAHVATDEQEVELIGRHLIGDLSK